MKLNNSDTRDLQVAIDTTNELIERIEKLEKAEQIIDGLNFSMFLRSGGYLETGVPAEAIIIPFLANDKEFLETLQSAIKESKRKLKNELKVMQDMEV